MLDRDQRLSKSQLVYCSCIQVRETSLLSIPAVRNVPSERQCRGHEGKLWICPHNLWDYSQARAFRDDPNRYQPAVAGAREFSWPYRPCERKNHSIGLGTVTLTTYRPLLAVDIGSTISKLAVATALRPLNLNVCPYIKLNDLVVRKHFSENCSMSQADCSVKDATRQSGPGSVLSAKPRLNSSLVGR